MLKISSVSERLDQWRREAYDYSSSSDRLGIVISRALELLLVVVKHGAGAENLKYAVDSLKWERNSAMHPEKDGPGSLRTHVYHLCEALELSMESVIERRGFETEETALPYVESDLTAYGSGDLLPPMAASTMTASASSSVPVEEEKPPTGIGMPTTTVGSSSMEVAVGYAGNEADMKMEDVEIKDEADNGFGMAYANPGSWEQEGMMVEFAQSEAGQSDEYPPSAEDEPTSSSKQKAQPGGIADKSVCELCGASFVRARDLRRHMKTIDHSVYRPRKFTKDRVQKYKCDQCPAQYTRVDNLTRHKGLHKGKARNIKCPHCEMMLVDNLNGHLREAHGIDPYPCQKCGQAFSRLELLKTHWTDCYERGEQFKNKSYD